MLLARNREEDLYEVHNIICLVRKLDRDISICIWVVGLIEFASISGCSQR
jgi:hypothetical protein